MNQAQCVAHLGRVGWGTEQRECVGSGPDPESRMGLGCQEEFVETGWCPRWCTRGQTQVGENFDDHGEVCNGREDGQGAAALRTGGAVDREDPFESWRPAHPGPCGSRGRIAVPLSAVRRRVGL